MPNSTNMSSGILPLPSTVITTGSIGSSIIPTGVTYGAYNTSPYTINTANVSATTQHNVMGSNIYSSGYTIGATTSPSSIVAFNSANNGEIVRLNCDGTVTWANGYNIDEASEAFAKVISIGAELSVGITQSVKQKMRDSVFNDLIDIAKEKGSLSVEDLTYLLTASKIVEKLKGGKE